MPRQSALKPLGKGRPAAQIFETAVATAHAGAGPSSAAAAPLVVIPPGMERVAGAVALPYVLDAGTVPALCLP